MDLTIMRDTLLPAVKDAALAVKRTSTLPVLSNVKLDANDDSLTVSGTDLNVFVSRTVWPQAISPGAITVNAKALLDALKAAPKGTLVNLTTVDEATPKVIIASNTGKVTLIGISADEFPINKSQGKVLTTVPGSALKRAIAEVEFAAASDYARPILNSISLRFKDNRLEFAAADNYQIAVTAIAAESDTEVQVLPDVVGMRLAAKILPDSEVAIGHEKNLVTLTWGEGAIAINCIDGQFPNYQQVIPVDLTTDVTFERAPFVAAVKAAGNVAQDSNNVVRFTINGTLTLEASADITGDFSTTVPAEISGEPIKIGMNARYIGNVAKVPDADDLRWQLKSPTGPSIVRRNVEGDPWMHVIMPVRIPQ